MGGFEFVNITDPKETKKHSTRVRRHVMKDIGKARRKQTPREKPGSRMDVGETTSKGSSREVTVSVGKSRDISGMATRAVGSPRVEGWISQMVFPIEMNEDKMGLVRFLVEESRYVFRPFRFSWLTMGLTDEAAWYITLANAAAWRGETPGSQRNDHNRSDEEVVRYYSMSLESISKRLQHITKESDSDGLIVAIAGCICHDTSLGNMDRMSVHREGLKRIVDQRGGLEKLKSPLVRLAISWLDLNAASFLYTDPYFVPPKESVIEVEDIGDDTRYLHTLLERWDVQCPYLGDIMDAITAVAKVANYINQHSHEPNFWEDDIITARLLGPAFHKVLTIEGRQLPDDPLDSRYSGIAAREAFRRAALIFLADVKIRCKAGAWELPRHLDAFRQISRLPLVDWAVVPELNMWAHIVAAIQEEDGDERKWHVAVIVGLMHFLRLRAGFEALGVARGVIWAESIMRDKAMKLEQEIDDHLNADALSRQLREMPLDPVFDPPVGEL
ncbi:hypothetical protein SCAR479_12119 [Seiridium cardinale]|uniref:Uncharacterized protein n=1 Tax=Seiridium cardinale TaxID=138064 RepID=A0ABR2XBU1_9PEZI